MLGAWSFSRVPTAVSLAEQAQTSKQTLTNPFQIRQNSELQKKEEKQPLLFDKLKGGNSAPC